MCAALITYIRCDTVEPKPLIPGSWDMIVESDRWVTLYPLGRVARPDIFFHARFIMRHPSFAGRGLFICTGGSTVLQHLADRIIADALPWTRVWTTMAEIRADVTTIAQQIKANWPDERPLNSEGQPIGMIVEHVRRMAGFSHETGE